MTRIFFSAGEASGDMHGANLIRALRDIDGRVQCEGLGGQRMTDAGMTLRFDLAGKAIMGFTEVVKSLGMIRRLFNETVAYLKEKRPDCLVLIDYPGFNMRLGKRAKALGIPVVYYISPQVWAWKKGRVFELAKFVEKMLVILPFEEELYARAGVQCRYVGHPLLDHLNVASIAGRFRGSTVIGLLPGSREQEIRRHMDVMIEVARGIRMRYPKARFIAPCVDHARESQVRALAGDFPVETAVGGMYEVLDAARFCLVASGTATLETALFGVPMVVMYRISGLSHWLARRLVSVAHIAMVNILAGRGIVPEFIQDEARAEIVLPAALDLIADTPARAAMLRDLTDLRAGLGGDGASRRAAEEIMNVTLKSQNA
ncbi:MAG: lipid-A-disaccharide synthase [Candidatus Hydrogenedentes bacterium]|nr:lipid-A-disaccharide synthase [Candidatus Hydrogenedentota bacterium]